MISFGRAFHNGRAQNFPGDLGRFWGVLDREIDGSSAEIHFILLPISHDWAGPGIRSKRAGRMLR